MDGGEFESSNLPSRTIAIAGAGISGLTAALALSRQGFRALVLEKSKEPSFAGTGIQISPNAYRCLEHLGLGRKISVAATAPSSIDIFAGRSGKKLTSFMLGQSILSRHNAPYLVLHRADLMNVLIDACDRDGSIDIRYDHKVTDIAQHANGVTLLAMVGGHLQEIHAKAFVGADGAWSMARGLMGLDTKPEFSGYVAWRGLVPINEVPSSIPRDATGLWLDTNSHLVHYPIRGGTVMNVIAITPWPAGQPAKEGWLKNSRQEHRLQAFKGWQPDIIKMIGQNSNWGGWPIYAFKKTQKAHFGAIGLIGDAAHAMVPYAAQGGAAAIEDAVVLAQCCGQSKEDLPGAFMAYNRARRARLNKMMRLAANNKRIYHASGAMRTIRDLSMKMAPQSAMQKRMDWLYGWTL